MMQPERAPLPDGGALSDCFGDQEAVAVAYADLLATSGVERGLIGPREVERLWQRHIFNCAAVADLVPAGASVVDVGSGAGLPGLVLAMRRPDLAVSLVEPLLRRCTWLTEVVEALGLTNVTVVRSRAEEQFGLIEADVVTARAVASLDVLAGWCLPLARSGGTLLALKGRSVGEEVTAAEPTLRRLGATQWDVVECGAAWLESVTTVVRVVAGERGGLASGGQRASRSGKSGRRATPPDRRGGAARGQSRS
jgi:16S rRNA (guanine527-N7)-methyltransferase